MSLAPVCLNRKGTPAATHWRRRSRIHSYRHIRAPGPDSPPATTWVMSSPSQGVRSMGPSSGSQVMDLCRMGAAFRMGSRKSARSWSSAVEQTATLP